ncbi:MAG TPA: DUF2845 domain-containing protein [Syntrophales bacterium]|nr:DUF2845 domain-containing protein [Syntrophales bacterium]
MAAMPVSAAMIAAILWIALWACSAWATDDIFRCGGNTVDRGDTTVRVLSLCGKPDFREELGDKEASSGKRVEKWHYNRGVGDFVYALTFEDGVLESVENAGRGY